jgi:hypothetical protein
MVVAGAIATKMSAAVKTNSATRAFVRTMERVSIRPTAEPAINQRRVVPERTEDA